MGLTFIVFGLFGLCIGSFLNVVVWRVPQGISIVTPGSACPSCRRELKVWENVPVVAWVALRGKCRTCHAQIPARYPGVELATGLGFAICGVSFAGGIAPAVCVAVAGLLTLALVGLDTRTFNIPIAAVAVGLTVGVAAAGVTLNRMVF